MTGDGGTEGRWSNDDLPGDLLAVIYRRCSSSYDRGRFAAVCTSWRAAAAWQSKLPAVPLLLPLTSNGWFDRKALPYSPEDGRVLRGPLPWFPYGKRIVGSYEGGWVAAAIGCRIDVVNLFTCAWVLHKGDITYLQDSPTKKIIFSKDPASQGCILVAMSTSRIALCRLGGPHGECPSQGCCIYRPSYPIDIAFCNGELYALSWRANLLYKFTIGLNKHNFPEVVSLQAITIEEPATFDPRPRYIFEMGGNLATAVVVGPVGSNKAQTFKVFELVGSGDTNKCMFAELTSLGDHALFLGPGCCKAVRMSSAMRGKVERNCVYYIEKEEQGPECLDRLDLGSCTVYCYQSKGVDRSEEITSRGYHYPEKGHRINDRNSCSWILPPRF